MTKKERTLTEAQFKKLVRNLARKAIKEQVSNKKKTETKKKPAPAPKKLSAKQLKEMVRDSVLDCLEEEVDRRLAAKKKAAAKK